MKDKSHRRSCLKTGIITLLILIIVTAALILGSIFLDLLYISSRVGSSLSWKAAYQAFEASFTEGMSRDEVHARLIEMDPSLKGALPLVASCDIERDGEVFCWEHIYVFYGRLWASGFSYIFEYDSELRLTAVDLSS